MTLENDKLAKWSMMEKILFIFGCDEFLFKQLVQLVIHSTRNTFCLLRF